MLITLSGEVQQYCRSNCIEAGCSAMATVRSPFVADRLHLMPLLRGAGRTAAAGFVPNALAAALHGEIFGTRAVNVWLSQSDA